MPADGISPNTLAALRNMSYHDIFLAQFPSLVRPRSTDTIEQKHLILRNEPTNPLQLNSCRG
jgi:hypothetical protein